MRLLIVSFLENCDDSAVMLFMYWIANFVVPGIILKDLQDDSTTRDKKTDEKDL